MVLIKSTYFSLYVVNKKIYSVERTHFRFLFTAYFYKGGDNMSNQKIVYYSLDAIDKEEAQINIIYGERPCQW